MRFKILIVLLILLSTSVIADDLYRVTVSNETDVDKLSAIQIEPIVRLNNGYLVLTQHKTELQLLASGLDAQLITSGITKDELALDNRFDRANVERYELLFEDGDLRLYRVNLSDITYMTDEQQIIPLAKRSIQITPWWTYDYKLDLSSQIRSQLVPLDSLISLVSQDSLYNYVSILQAFDPRVQGSQANFNARDWIYDKFVDYGYDSLYLDPFSSGYNNIVAVKVGSRFPDYQVVIGGHFDAVNGSPGADDNGSGTAGVLEMARILADIETDMTIIFIAFDAEESGLNGSYHYADAAAFAGDNIVLMFNMDMIANEGNTTDVKTYHGDNMEFPNLFNQLADSLVDLTGHLSGNISASDHWPFHQNGYTIIMAHEYIFSSVYHSYQDSTSHMDFPYMTKVVKAGLATCYVASQTAGPLPELAFNYPTGVPTYVFPGVGTTFEVIVSGLNEGIPVPGTGQLHYNSNNHGWVHVDMTEISANHYEAFIPGSSCFTEIEFYITAVEETEGEYRDPDILSPPYVAIVATDEVVAFEDDFETLSGWTFSGGQWAIGAPTGGGGSSGNPDPDYAVSGFSILGYNLNGDYDRNIPEYHATSPAIDCSGLIGTKLSFWRYLGVEQSSYDHAYVRISTNGSSWTTIWENSGTITDAGFSLQLFDLSNIADSQATVYVRFTMGSTDNSVQLCGWNIDDIKIEGYECTELSPQITTTQLPDWTAGLAYSQQLTASGGTGVLTWTDHQNDLIGTGLTLASGGLLSGTPTNAGLISFTARVSDEADSTDQQVLGFTINPAIEITTVSVPDGVVGELYDYMLTASGGTGVLNWIDKNSDLGDTGIALMPTGQLNGYPLNAEQISFTAEVTDEVGAVEERLYTFNIAEALICGDADASGEVDISDAVYLIAYIFGGGPAPDSIESSDADCSGAIDISDAVYIIAYIFGGGPAPCEACP